MCHRSVTRQQLQVQMPALSEYELQREENIRKNKELLLSLGLDQIFPPPKQAKSPVKKRKAAEDDTGPPQKASKKSLSTEERGKFNTVSSEGLRRSSRNAGKVVDYKSERHETPAINLKGHLSRDSEPRNSTHRKHDP